MNDFKIFQNKDPHLLREDVIELLNKGWTIVNTWSDDRYWYTAMQKIDPITVAAYANQTWGDR